MISIILAILKWLFTSGVIEEVTRDKMENSRPDDALRIRLLRKLRDPNGVRPRG